MIKVLFNGFSNPQKYKFYVYALSDPLDKKPFYIGKGVGSRINHHEREAERGVCSHKCNKIRKIKRSGKEIIKTKIASFKNENVAYSYEAHLISAIGIDYLTNISLGMGGAYSKPVDLAKEACDALLSKRDALLIWDKETDGGKFKIKVQTSGGNFYGFVCRCAERLYNEIIPELLFIVMGDKRQSERLAGALNGAVVFNGR